jgi:dolichol-phosphate mannosyltransferase
MNNIVAFSDKPLRLTAKTGLIIAMLSFITGIIYFVLYLIGSIQVLGFTTLILSIWFLAGIIILILGVLGLYVGKVFEKVKERPTYIISDKYNI